MTAQDRILHDLFKKARDIERELAMALILALVLAALRQSPLGPVYMLSLYNIRED